MALQDLTMMPLSRLGCPLSLKTPNMGNTGLTHDQILQRVWGSEYSGESELLRATVKNLRRKLGPVHTKRFGHVIIHV